MEVGGHHGQTLHEGGVCPSHMFQLKVGVPFIVLTVVGGTQVSPMPFEIQCVITKDGTETMFEFTLPDRTVQVTVPAVLNDEQCTAVIDLFVENITTNSTNHALTSSEPRWS